MSKHVSSKRRAPATALRPVAASPAPRSPAWLAPVVVVLAALAIRLAVLAQLGGDPLLQPRGVLDDAAYVRLASRVAAGDLALAPDVYYLAPFYTYFLGLVFAATGGSLQAARLVQVALGAGTVALVMATSFAWWSRRAALVAGALAAATGLLAFNEILILQSSVDAFLTALALFVLTRAVRGPSWGRLVAAGGALGALAANRPNALPAIAVVALLWVVVHRSRAAVAQAVALGLGTLLVLAPFALRNRVVAGEWVLITSHGGLNYYIGNNAQSDGTWRATPGVRASIEGQKEDVRRVAAQALGRPVTSGEASAYFFDLAWQWIRLHPAAWAALQMRKLALTFNAVDVGLNVSYTYFARDEFSLLSLLPVGPWLIIPLGLFGLCAAAPRSGRGGYFAWASFVPAYALSVAAFFVSSRYRLPLVVPLLVTSGAAVDWLWGRARAPLRARAAAPAVAGLLVLFVFVNWPIRADTGRMFEREERMVQLIMDRRFAEGKRLLAATEAQHPNPAVMFYRVGLAFTDRGEPNDAALYLGRALALNPTEPWIRFNLAEALVKAGRPTEAIPHLEAVRAAGIEPVSTAYDLAAAYRATGQTARAREALASIQVTPKTDAAMLVQLGAAAMRLDDLPLAERFLREAVVRAPGLAAAHEHLGVALGMQHKAGEAVVAFETAVGLEPSSASACFHLAVALAEVGRFADARQAAERAVRLRPDDGAARALLQSLRAPR
jgi:tetratricopeptide (TPR) repeat protein